MKVEVTIGWTKSKMPEYSSFADGYRPGAEQHTETIVVETEPFEDPQHTVEAIAEAAFVATNSPYEVSGLASQIREGIEATGYNGRGAHYSLSVGDTVTVGEVTVACESFGWKRVGMVSA